MDKAVEDQGVAFGPGLRPYGAEPATQSQAEPLVPNADTFRQIGVSCDNCRFGYHWAETRHRYEDGPLKGVLFRTPSSISVPYQAKGIQCFRYPIPEDAEADYWCGEYQPASGIVAATAGETEGLDERSEQSPVGEAETPKVSRP